MNISTSCDIYGIKLYYNFVDDVEIIYEIIMNDIKYKLQDNLL